MDKNKVKVVIADDHPLLRFGLKTIVSRQPGFIVVGEAQNGEEAVAMVSELKPDIVLMDLEMPLMDGITAIGHIKRKLPAVKTAILTMHREEKHLIRALDVGVDCFLLKDFAMDEVGKCLTCLVDGDVYFSNELQEFIKPLVDTPIELNDLSKTERKVLRQIAKNKTTKEIAKVLFVSPKTIENHRTNINKKLRLQARKNSLLYWALQHKDLI